MTPTTLILLFRLLAQPAQPEPTPAETSEVAPVPEQAPLPGPEAGPDPKPEAAADLSPRVQELEQKVAQLQTEAELLRGAKPAPGASLAIADGVRLRFNGYGDLGFFDAAGDGVAYVRDVGHTLRPEHSNVPWVFLGDPWANPINAQGESADLGLDRTNIDRFDPIGSGGRASFIVNRANLAALASIGGTLLFETSVNFDPRQGELGSSGDLLDVDLAYLEWQPLPTRDLHVFAGKFESTFGIEYRSRKAPDRFGITPSLISRYTSGTFTGLKVRGSVAEGALIYNVALTNGTPIVEGFAHFGDEIDRNDSKTASGRLAFRQQGDGWGFELGASGFYGVQDQQPSGDPEHWQIGADLKADVGDFTLRAEVLRSRAGGGGLAEAPLLRSDGFYVETSFQALPWVGALLRLDRRDALLFTEPNLYLTDTVRITGALRFDISFNVVAKLEYLHLIEREGPDLDDDVWTSSLIFRF